MPSDADVSDVSRVDRWPAWEDDVAELLAGFSGWAISDEVGVLPVDACARSSASGRVSDMNSLMDLWKAGLSTAQSDGQMASSMPSEFDRALSRDLEACVDIDERLRRPGGLSVWVVI